MRGQGKERVSDCKKKRFEEGGRGVGEYRDAKKS